MWQQSDKTPLTELTEYLDKLNSHSVDNMYVDIRKCRKVCNRALNIKYNISSTETTIKSFIYYIGTKHLCTILCKGFKELKVGLDIHKDISSCRTLTELNTLLERYGISSGGILHL